MNRRNLIMATFAASGLFVAKSLSDNITSLNSGLGFLKKIRSKKYQEVESGKMYIAQPNTLFILPQKAQEGDSVHIIVDRESLHAPCSIQNITGKIAGENEPLQLDTLVILKLKFNARNNDWELA